MVIIPPGCGKRAAQQWPGAIISKFQVFWNPHSEVTARTDKRMRHGEVASKNPPHGVPAVYGLRNGQSEPAFSPCCYRYARAIVFVRDFDKEHIAEMGMAFKKPSMPLFFSNGETISQKGQRNIAELKVGLEGKLSNNLNVWGNVAGQRGDNTYSHVQGTLGVRYSF